MATPKEILTTYLESKTYDELLAEAIAKAPKGIDVREGSIYYDAVAPMCYELATAYEDLETLLVQTYASMAEYPYLDIRCAERGVYRIPAKKAQILVYFSQTVGERQFPKEDIKVRDGAISGLMISTTDETPNWTYEVIRKYTLTVPKPASVTRTFEDGSFLKAEATAKYAGSIGNQITFEIVSAEAGTAFKLNTYLGKELKASAILAKGSYFNKIGENECLKIRGTGEVRVVEPTNLTGGQDIGTIQAGYYVAESSEAGTRGSSYAGQLLPVENIGDATCILCGIVAYGTDIETDEELRARYFKFLNNEAFGGNIAHYVQWLTDVNYGAPTGIGAVQVYPVWAGGGTVSVSIINTEFEPVSQEFIKEVENFLDPRGEMGQGDGIAPIGHKVSVFTPTEIGILFKIKIKIINPAELEKFRLPITETLTRYLKEVRQTWAELNKSNNLYDKNTLIHSTIVSRISLIDGILEVKDTELLLSKDGKEWKAESLNLIQTGSYQEVGKVADIELSTYN